MTADLIQIESDALVVTVSALGAELQSLEADGAQWLWHGDATFWGGRAPVLFPIVGRGPDDTISVDGHVAAMRQHGFARRSLFLLEEVGADFCRHVLTDSAETRALYPRPFRLEVRHDVSGRTLRETAIVTNTGDRPMPFGLGFHPAFAWPLPGAEGLPHEICLDNGAAPALARLRDGYLTETRDPSPFEAGRLRVTPDLFEADAMIFPEGAGSGLRYGPAEGPGLKFSFENTPNLGIWTKPGAPFLCIEPWHGMAARAGAGPEVAERPDSVLLPPGETLKFGWSITLE
ncbi:aldose 1-epimerase family protein [Pseudooceanicola sp. CBS1P-1]|uniref:Aldose 1-epimerase family protein n=1 Tax=Pseudooceanicola albus TaxID=2692189 RepID=A0A6L7G4E1_9RHOB|nr:MULTISPECIES: aldose 1-epimerase family protein [Pseudooceanicola]MBT9383046.1 aldose 1-epimerase family protein [Pseudooceanicola endophyticus]MXN19234.1 aldose 1-epimerase family protein [Pseudooceanicola albus]